ncbi:MAG: hypothetical protein Q9164_006537, partial [Protoblastenia rupestris]
SSVMTRDLAPHAVHRLEKESKHVYTENWARAVSAIDGDDATRAHSSPPNLALSRLYELCLQAFRLTCCANNPSGSSLCPGISVSSMRNELARFNLWGDEIAMDLIDRALGPADFLMERVLLHLLQIGRLSWARDNETTAALRQILEEKIRFESSNGQANPKGETSDDEDSEDDMADIPDDIGFRTQCLLELAPTIQGCIDHAENLRFPAIPAEEFTVSGPAYYYVQIVQDKFKEAPRQLVQRLGEANWQRHNRLRQLASGHEEFNDATTVAKPKSLFHDSGIGTTETGGTSYAASVKSHSSFISSNATGERTGLRVPSAPVEVKHGQPFSCSLCGHMQYKIKNRVDWKVHVFADLRPYISRARPIEQEECFLCKQKPATTKRSFLKHVGQHMEEIALMALPVTESNENDSVDTEDSHVSNHTAEKSHPSTSLASPLLFTAADEQSAKKLLLKHGIDLRNLSVAQFDSFRASPPSVQLKAIEIYWEGHREDVLKRASAHTEGEIRLGARNSRLPLSSGRLSNENPLSEEEWFSLPTEPSNTDAAIDTKLSDPSENIPLSSRGVIMSQPYIDEEVPEKAVIEGLYPRKGKKRLPASQSSYHPSGDVTNVDPVILEPPTKPKCWDHDCNGRIFSTISNLLRHQREKSGITSKPTCPNCGAEFTRRSPISEQSKPRNLDSITSGKE